MSKAESSSTGQKFSVTNLSTLTMGENYNKYYQPLGEGGVSIYEQQYGSNVLSRDRHQILKVALGIAQKKAAKGDYSFTVTDYGAGDGRYFGVMEELYAELRKIHRDFTLKVIAYDPSNGGLELYKKKLEAHGFQGKKVGSYTPLYNMSERLAEQTATGENKYKHGALGYKSDTLSADGLSVEFVHGDPGDTVETTKRLLGPSDLSLLMFGVLSHIPRREKAETEEDKALWRELLGLGSNDPLGASRQETLQLHRELLNDDGAILLTTPSPQRFKKEQSAFEVLREQDNAFGWARDPNTFYYAKFRKKNTLNSSTCLSPDDDPSKEKQIREAYNFYKVYTRQELAEDLYAAGFDAPSINITIDYIAHIETLLFSAERSKQPSTYIPSFISSHIPSVWGHKRDEWASWAISGVCNWLSGPILTQDPNDSSKYVPSISYNAQVVNSVMDWISSYEMAVAYKPKVSEELTR